LQVEAHNSPGRQHLFQGKLTIVDIFNSFSISAYHAYQFFDNN